VTARLDFGPRASIRAVVAPTRDGDLFALAKAVTQVSGLRRLRILSPRACLETRQSRSAKRQ
jgi:hypothetical protein